MKTLSLLPTVLFALLHATSTTAWVIRYFSDDNCQSWVGQDSGSDARDNIAWTFAWDQCTMPCTIGAQGSPNACGNARSFQIWMPNCFQGVLSIGGVRHWSNCNNFVCLAQYVDGSYSGDNNCKRTNGKVISGFSVAYNPRSGQCNGKRDAESEWLQMLAEKNAEQEKQAREIMDEVEGMDEGPEKVKKVEELVGRGITC